MNDQVGGSLAGRALTVRCRACTDESTGRMRLAKPKPRQKESIALPIAPDANKSCQRGSYVQWLPSVLSSLPQLWPPGTFPLHVDAPSRETLKRGQPGLEYNPAHGLTSEDFSRPPQPSPAQPNICEACEVR